MQSSTSFFKQFTPTHKPSWIALLLLLLLALPLTIYALPKPDAKVCGTYFYDRNGNGVQDSHESGASGRLITAQNSLDGRTNSAVTGRSGAYCITAKSVDTETDYYVFVSNHRGWAQTFPQGAHTIQFADWLGGSFEMIEGIDFGAQMRMAPIRMERR